MTKTHVVIGAVCGCALLVLVATVLVLGGVGGLGWFVYSSDGSIRRARQSAAIGQALAVEILHQERGEEPAAETGHASIACRVAYENRSDKAIVASTGSVLFADGNGWTAFDGWLDSNQRIGPHERVVEDRVLDCFAHAPSSGSVETVDVTALSPTWLGQSVTFEDGTTIAVGTP